MSIYSTISLTRSEAIKLIAEHVCANADYPNLLDKATDDDLLEWILFKLTNGNKYSPFHMNNYWIVEGRGGESNLAEFKEENYL